MDECSRRALNQQVESWINDNGGLIRVILYQHLKVFFNTTNRRFLPSPEECSSVTYLAAVEAFNSYDDSRGKFNYYYRLVLWSTICQWFKNDSQVLRNRHRNYTHAKNMRHIGKEPTLIESDTVSCDYLFCDSDIADIDKKIVSNELYSGDIKKMFDMMTEPLNDISKEIIWLRFGMGMTFKEIGKKFGKSKQHINIIIRTSLKVMKQHPEVKRFAASFGIVDQT